MNRITILPALLLLAFGSQWTTDSKCDAEELMSPLTASRLGLEEVWRRQMRLPGGAASIVDQQIIVNTENPREYVEVLGKAAEGQQPPVLFRIPTDQAGPNGQPIGKEEAERLARREERRLKRRHPETTISSRVVPRIQMFTAAKNGTIECRDAESGAPIWMTQVGDHRLHFGKMGIDDKFVSITNGGNLIKIDATNGEPIKTIRTTSMPLYGAVNAGDFALVPTIRNGVEGYPLEDITIDPFMEIVAGLCLEPPTKSPSSSKVAWATDRGFVYVMELSGRPSVLFRLNTDGLVSGRIAAASGDRFFFGSEAGQVYGVEATRTGDVLWSRPYGEPFYNAPFLVEGMVMMVSTYGNLYALDEKTGLSRWENATPNVDEVLGGFDGKLYVRLLSRSFAVIDLKTGNFLENDPSLLPITMLVNRTTDRLYLVNSQGTVQCLRTIGHDLPTLSESKSAEEKEATDETKTEAKPDKPAAPTTDPFGAADPFGAGGGDPFGAGAAGGSPDAMDDPFATPAGADPFGG
ncbi:PQQ-binding-like beta-propeller repeat protein [Stieleria sp. TO1_6]|uniref:outer membrane protein assembly factor BamB family protein n=1 Tax=Stieleria tagensis TaxID=2956795 RepID=UPI00209BA2FD|nr:PQQ-binding-like beta-propeller repeat protein [Stieleria tagensis]MCO8121205.1 PQQ-binding-like beta-propeller repeat protein [Stieleria tagensis]